MADKQEVTAKMQELVRLTDELPAGAGREMIRTSMADALNNIEVILTDEGRFNADSLLASGRAFKRFASAEATNGTSWCC